MIKPDSYPFLKIARKFGVDYGDVLLVADRWRGYIGNPHWIAADRRLYQQLTPENNMALSFAIEAANAEFKRIQAGEIDWRTGEELCQDEGCPHYGTPHGHGAYKPRDPGPDATIYAGQRLEDQKPVCKYCGQDHSTIHPNGAKMFADDCTMLDDKGNRSIFDDVDAMDYGDDIKRY